MKNFSRSSISDSFEILVCLNVTLTYESLIVKNISLEDESNNWAIVTEGLMYNIFGRRRFNIPLPVPSRSWTVRKLLSFLDEAVEIADREISVLSHQNYDTMP